MKKRCVEQVGDSIFQVSVDIDNTNAWKQCFSVKGVKLPTGYYFGASAATGDLAGE